jgi:hypothetical protein
MAEPIHLEEEDDEIHQIEYLGTTRAIVQIWGGYEYESDKGEYGVYYENLPDDVIDEIFEIIMEYISKGPVE